MALISTTTTAADGTPSGEFVFDAFTSVNLRASHTIMVRVKNGSTATNYHSIACAYFDDGDLTGSGIGRTSGQAGTGMNWFRQAGFFSSYSRNTTLRSTCYGNTTTWYHLCLVYNATTANIRAYIDGVFIGQQSSATGNVDNQTSNQFIVGAANGKFADAAMFNRALTDQEVADMAAYRVPQVTSGLVVFWRLDANANDSSGNGNNGAESGGTPAVSWSTADNPPQPENPAVAIAGDAASSSAFAGSLTNFRLLAGPAASTSALGGSLNTLKPVTGAAASTSALGGQLRAHIVGAASSTSALSAVLTSQIQVAGAAASSSSLGAWLRPRWGRRFENGSGLLTRSATMLSAGSEWTFAAWVRPISIGTDTHNALFSLYTAGTASARIGVRRTSGTLRTYILADDNSAGVISHQSANDGNWHHVAVTYDGVSLRAFIDGSQVASAAGTITGDFTFLTVSASASTVAEYAHVKLWSKALTGTELTSEATYYTPHVANAQLYAWWQLAWNDVTLDSSGNGQTLTDSASTEAQTESPGLPLQLLTGALSTTSAFAGTPSVAKPLAGDAATQSVFQGTITVTLPFVGAAGASSAFQASLTALVSGAGASSSSFAASLGTLKPIAGDAASSSAFAAALTALLTGNGSTSSALAGALVQTFGVAGDTASSSAFAGILGLQGLFGGLAQSSSAFGGDLIVEKPVAGDAASSSALSAALVQNYAIASALGSASALGGTLGVLLDVQGTLTTTSAFGGTLTVPLQIQGAAASVSAFGGTLGTTVTLTGALASSSAFTAQLTAQIAGDLASTSALAAQLRLLHRLEGSAATGSILTGNISVTQAQRPLAVNSATASQLIGAMTVTVVAAASGSNVTDGSAKAEYGPSDIPSVRPGRRWPPRY